MSPLIQREGYVKNDEAKKEEVAEEGQKMQPGESLQHDIRQALPQLTESIVATIRESLIVLDANLRVVFANSVFCEVFKVDLEDTRGEYIYELGNRQWDIPELRKLLEDILPQNTHFDGFRVEHDFPPIGHRVMLLNARRMCQADEQTELILLAIEDITEREKAKEEITSKSELLYDRTEELVDAWEQLDNQIERRAVAEASLQESEQLLQAVVSDAPVILFALDSYGTFLMYEGKGLVFTEPEPGKLVGQNAFELFQERPEIADAINRALEGEELYEAVESPLGMTYETSFSPFRNAKGNIIGVIGVGTDITQRKKAQAALRASEARLAEAQRIAHFGNWEWDIANNTLSWSDEIYRIFGLTPQEFDASFEAFLDRVHPDDRESVNEAVKKALYQNQPYSIEHRIVQPDDVERFVQERGKVYSDDNGRPVRMLGTVHDITERKRLEAQLFQSQKMEAVGLLVGGIAHDFNNLLVVIGGRARRALKRMGENDPLRKEVEEVIRAEESATSLVRQLLAFGRKQVMRPEVVNINRIISGAEMMMRRLIREDITFLILAESNLGLVEVDPSQIEQVIMNLVVNARDAMPEGGKIVIRTANVTLGKEYADGYLAPPGDYVMLDISDDGCGIDSETLSHIFEPFFTTKALGEGTGLGLSTVYGIIRQSGGDIRVYSEPGHGTTFKVYLPRVEEPDQNAEKAKTEDSQPRKGSETILLVEDEATVREVIQAELQDLGYTVLEAGSGEEALDISQQHEGPIHVVVTDVVMPGMSGPELCEVLENGRAGIKVLFTSGYSEEAVIRRGILRPDSAFIEKPFTTYALAHSIRELLSS